MTRRALRSRIRRLEARVATLETEARRPLTLADVVRRSHDIQQRDLLARALSEPDGRSPR